MQDLPLDMVKRQDISATPQTSNSIGGVNGEQPFLVIAANSRDAYALADIRACSYCVEVFESFPIARTRSA